MSPWFRQTYIRIPDQKIFPRSQFCLLIIWISHYTPCVKHICMHARVQHKIIHSNIHSLEWRTGNKFTKIFTHFQYVTFIQIFAHSFTNSFFIQMLTYSLKGIHLFIQIFLIHLRIHLFIQIFTHSFFTNMSWRNNFSIFTPSKTLKFIFIFAFRDSNHNFKVDIPHPWRQRSSS